MERRVYIYCYTNKINFHKYVGQTYNLYQRQADHKSNAFNKKHKDYNNLFHKKIRQYGLENFNFEVLEEKIVSCQEEADELEEFWIKEKNSYVKNGEGYNLTLGGQGSRTHFERAKITEEQLYQIINDIKNTSLKFVEIEAKYNLPRCYITDINTGRRFKLANETYPIRPKRVIDKKAILNYMLTHKTSNQKTADFFKISITTVKRIKAENINKFNKQIKK